MSSQQTDYEHRKLAIWIPMKAEWNAVTLERNATKAKYRHSLVGHRKVHFEVKLSELLNYYLHNWSD